MKYFLTFLGMALISGCSTSPDIPKFTIKNLDSNVMNRHPTEQEGPYKEIIKQYEITISSNGRPSVNSEFIEAAKSDKIQSIKFLIDQNAKLKDIARITKKFVDFERLEFWTQYGIFIVGAPSYGFRRLPQFHKKEDGSTELGKDLNLIIKKEQDKYTIAANDEGMLFTYEGKDLYAAVPNKEEILFENKDINAIVPAIFLIFRKNKVYGFKNVYFSFSPEDKWGDVELVMALMFNHIESFRGFWIGYDKEGNIKMHFYDIYIYK